MITEAKSMACGNCGRGLFKMFKDNKGLLCECTGCHAVTTIRVSVPEVVLDWAEGNDKGILTRMDFD